tara:strand:+ start:1515 stop:1706 length:192 start_codon:yes stop_codon:yes gene_type:complete
MMMTKAKRNSGEKTCMQWFLSAVLSFDKQTNTQHTYTTRMKEEEEEEERQQIHIKNTYIFIHY